MTQIGSNLRGWRFQNLLITLSLKRFRFQCLILVIPIASAMLWRRKEGSEANVFQVKGLGLQRLQLRGASNPEHREEVTSGSSIPNRLQAPKHPMPKRPRQARLERPRNLSEAVRLICKQSVLPLISFVCSREGRTQ